MLFADLVGSTELADSQNPERTRALLNRFYDAMAAEIEGAGGTVEKFVGDAVMAAFGAPAAQEDHAERALHAALSMQRRLEELFGDSLSLRIGVNTGEVVVGQPREGSSFVTGDAVNVAARLEQAAEPGEVLVGERTAAAVRGAFELDEPRRSRAKGKAEGVACRRLVRALSLMRPRGVGGLHRAFVGRERELEALQAAFCRVRDEAQSRLVTIMGHVGVGKTTLVRVLWEWLGTQAPEPLRRVGRCLSYGQGITYLPLGEVVREHLGLLESDPPETVRRRLGQHEILGMTLGLEAPSGLHPLAARDRLHRHGLSFSRSWWPINLRSCWSKTCTGETTHSSTFSRRRCMTSVGRCFCWQLRGRSSFAVGPPGAVAVGTAKRFGSRRSPPRIPLACSRTSFRPSCPQASARS